MRKYAFLIMVAPSVALAAIGISHAFSNGEWQWLVKAAIEFAAVYIFVGWMIRDAEDFIG